jgi:two-component system, OmpR family, KDP operon response regulator KdpE
MADNDRGRILLIEDDRALREVVAAGLERGGHSVTVASDGRAGLEALKSPALDIVLLDIGLPFVDGWRILATLEGHRQPSVIVISARGDEQDKVRALDLGADDYLTKPFGSGELLARVRAVLRRVRPLEEVAQVISCEDVVIDLGSRTVSRSGAEVRLSPTEYVLLAELARNAGTLMDQRRLLSRVWGPSYVGDRAYLRTFIQRLRRKLESDPATPSIIVTVGRQGYRFGPMQEITPPQ